MADKIATREAYGQVLVELGEKYNNLVVTLDTIKKLEEVYA